MEGGGERYQRKIKVISPPLKLPLCAPKVDLGLLRWCWVLFHFNLPLPVSFLLDLGVTRVFEKNMKDMFKDLSLIRRKMLFHEREEVIGMYVRDNFKNLRDDRGHFIFSLFHGGRYINRKWNKDLVWDRVDSHSIRRRNSRMRRFLSGHIRRSRNLDRRLVLLVTLQKKGKRPQLCRHLFLSSMQGDIIQRPRGSSSFRLERLGLGPGLGGGGWYRPAATAITGACSEFVIYVHVRFGICELYDRFSS